ncbi:nuclear transport factor 2 family protein [Streptomyces sp. NBC_00038]|uniref:YybH family protein n=1 Tax=unclassified Streptomyces TaxID=2593676 RepID=UPI00225BFAC7|nr:nuclear transport factor 2 family protein [Streptomyces sp. NBC_00038]MCX5554561.1 nuclear transport factor 2 family protein [Streptomyces sp. NBC_00038]WUC09199.1 nuclear transport factor 2 family protein [Streptomyces sp. NBC_00564]
MSTPLTDPSQLPPAFEKAMNSGNLDEVMSLFAPGAVMRTVTGETVTGQALRDYTAGSIAGNAQLSNGPSRIVAGADTALISEEWTLEVTTPDGNRQKATGTTANVASRGQDGTWRMAILNPLGTA